jgi:hypothetical protein
MVPQILLKVIFLNCGHTCPSGPGYLNALKPKDPRPALLGNGEPEEKPRPLENTPPDMEMGQLAKKNYGGKRNAWIEAHLPKSPPIESWGKLPI